MNTNEHKHTTSPRKAFGGNIHQKRLQGRPWWQWCLFGIVFVGLAAFFWQLFALDRSQITYEQLRGLLILAAVLFFASLALIAVEIRRYIKRNKENRSN